MAGLLMAFHRSRGFQMRLDASSTGHLLRGNSVCVFALLFSTATPAATSSRRDLEGDLWRCRRLGLNGATKKKTPGKTGVSLVQRLVHRDCVGCSNASVSKYARQELNL